MCTRKSCPASPIASHPGCTMAHLLCTQEVRSILRARKLGVTTPVLYYVEHAASSIYMEKVQGVSVKAALQSKQLDEQGRRLVSIHKQQHCHLRIAFHPDVPRGVIP